MWGKFYLAVVVAAISGTIMSVGAVPIAQSAEDDSASCESCEPSTLTQAMNLVREGFQVLKNLIGANQPQNNEAVSKKDLEDLKNACASNQEQTSAANASSLCEYRARLNALVGLNAVVA